MRGSSFFPPKRLIAAYVLDWACIVIIAAIGVAFNYKAPYKRPFSLADLSISYPYVEAENIPTWLLIVVSVVAPAAIIFGVCIVFVPGPTVSRQSSRSSIWRRKLWEWNTGWMGLGLSLALAFMFTSGMKNLFGKPRPDLLDRCDPDLSDAAIALHRVGGYSTSFDQNWGLVNAGICRQQDRSLLNDGWRSFPSGHSSTSWSGLFYLTLFLVSKFNIGIPSLSSILLQRARTSGQAPSSGRQDSVLPVHGGDENSSSARKGAVDTSGRCAQPPIPPRNQAAAPPIYLLALPLVPICTAIYISSTRYFQFFHHGFDIIVGSVLGMASAWFAFRLYHLPIGQGAGRSWGARTTDRALFIGVGVPGYVGPEGWTSTTDVEQNQIQRS